MAGQHHKMHMRGMQNLNLTDDQKSKIHDIRAKTWDQIKAVRNDASLSDTQKKQQVHRLRKNAHKQVASVLTPEQREQWKQNMKQARERHQQKMQQQGQEQPKS